MSSWKPFSGPTETECSSFLLKKLAGTFNTLGTTDCLETKITELRVKNLTEIGLL